MEQWLLHLEWPFPLTFCLWIIMHPKSSPLLPIKKGQWKHNTARWVWYIYIGLVPVTLICDHTYYQQQKDARDVDNAQDNAKDCGQCKDMPKFGGLGRKKKPSIFRKCRGMPFASDEGKILCFCSTHSKNIITPAIWLHILRAIKGMPQHTAWWWPQSKHYRESIPNSSTTDWSKSTLYNARR